MSFKTPLVLLIMISSILSTTIYPGDIYPLKGEIPLSMSGKSTLYSSFSVYSHYAFHNNFDNSIRLTLSKFKNKMGYGVSYEHEIDSSIFSIRTGEELPIHLWEINDRLIYPNLLFVGFNYNLINFRLWSLDSDAVGSISINDNVQIGYSNSLATDLKHSLSAFSISATLPINWFNSEITAKISSLTTDKTIDSGSQTIIKITRKDRFDFDLPLRTQISFSNINTHWDSDPNLSLVKRSYTLNSFQSALIDNLYSKKTYLFSARSIFEISDYINIYLKYQKTNHNSFQAFGAIYKWRKNLNFQLNIDQSSTEEGYRIWMKVFMFDNLII